MRYKLLITFILFFGIQATYAQVPTCFQLQVFSGMVGDDRGQERTYSSFDTEFSFRPGWNYGLGLTYHFRLNDQWGLRIGAAYENANFTREEYYEFLTFRKELRSGDIIRTYNNQSVLLPFDLLWRSRKWGFNLGILTNVHLQTNMEQAQFFYAPNAETQTVTRTYQSGQYIESDPYNWERTELDQIWNLQWSLGFAYQILPRLSLDLNIRDYLFSNQLSQEVKVIDVVGTYTDRWDTFARSVNLGMNWQLLK